MKKNNLFLFAVAAITFVACSEAIETPQMVDIVQPETPQEAPIVFGSLSKGITRADIVGADAAKLLKGQFVVSGYKGDLSKWDDAYSTIVFDNYAVRYHENSAHTSETNTDNWEYVGEERIAHAITNGITRQSTKYWDYTQPQYDFIAWSTGTKTAIYEMPTSGTIPEGSVLVSAITPTTAVGEKDAAVAYTMQGMANDLKDCYIADLVTVKKAQYGNTPVTIRFRSLGTKVRIGLYETIPGYSVRDVEFYSAANVKLVEEGDDLPGSSTEHYDAEGAAAANATPKIFTTEPNDIFTQGIYTIYYPTVDDEDNADNNQAHISFSGTGDQSTIVNFGSMDYTIAEDGEKTPGKVYLGRTSNTATMAGEAEGNYYTQYLPNEKGTNLNLRVNYTLESIDGSGETIYVKGATAQVPSIYTQWKSGFAYTYLFKISDKTNGYTGDYNPLYPDDTTINSDPAGLYPITFDAVVVDAEDDDQTQETITLVSTPSITTYQEGSNVVNNDEYLAENKIYVVVTDGNEETTPDLANGAVQKLTDKVALYTIPTVKTEAEVIDALQMRDDYPEAGTILGRSGLVLTEAPLGLTGRVNYGVDGNAIIVGKDKVAMFAPVENTTYAFVYTKKAADPANDKEYFEPVTKEVGQGVAGLYRYALKNAPEGDVQKGVTYFTSSSKDAVTVFIGQDVSNLYLDDTGSEIAKGYASTGTTYYYTTDNGMSYKAAKEIKYEDFASTTLYTDAACTIEKTETTPENTAYYFKDDDDNISYCVIYPQQTKPVSGDRLKVIDTTAAKLECTGSMKAIKGMTYFDKYTQNDGVYYVKIIKVQ